MTFDGKVQIELWRATAEAGSQAIPNILRQRELATSLMQAAEMCERLGRSFNAEHERLERLTVVLDRKMKTWARLCECTNEFGADADKSCGEFLEQDDAAMLEMETVYEDIRRERQQTQ